MEFHLALIELKPWKTVNMFGDTRNHVTVYTDASCEPVSGELVVKLCYIIFADSETRGGIATMSNKVLNSMEQTQTFIAHGEAFAPLFAIFHEHDILANRAVMWFMDNMGILACFCKGSSVVADISCIIHASLLAMASPRICSWYEHVDSKANIADGGTRNFFEVAEALGVSLVVKSLPPWPSNTVKAPPRYWLEWLNVDCQSPQPSQ